MLVPFDVGDDAVALWNVGGCRCSLMCVCVRGCCCCILPLHPIFHLKPEWKPLLAFIMPRESAVHGVLRSAVMSSSSQGS